MKRRYTVLGVVTALLPNLYAYAGESQASSMAGGASSSAATTQSGSESTGRSSSAAQTSQTSGSSTSNNTQSSTQGENKGASQPYQNPVGSSTDPVQGRTVSDTMAPDARPVVKNYGKSKNKPKKRTAVIRTYR